MQHRRIPTFALALILASGIMATLATSISRADDAGPQMNCKWSIIWEHADCGTRAGNCCDVYID